ISNYETDIFRPLFDALEKLSGKQYGSTLPTAVGGTGDLPVPVGAPSTGTAKRSHSPLDVGWQQDAPPHFAGLAARRDGPAARSTQVEPDAPLKTSGEGPSNIIEVPLEGAEFPVEPEANGQNARATAEQVQIDIAFRVIADHIRTLSFAIADGIQPGNNDRNYVLRRILRRAVRYGRTLGFREPFFYKLVDVLADTMGNVFPEIRAKKKQVQEVIRVEEEAFNKTLDKGIARFEEMYSRHAAQVNEIARAGNAPTLIQFQPTVFIGDYAFELYDTYGFPYDLTELMARERGLTVDREGFEKLMGEQRARARAAQKKEVISLSQVDTTTPTKFVGYEHLSAEAQVLEVLSLKDKTAVILDTSACYAEMGGQVGDTGELTGNGQLWRVTNTQKSGNTWLHFIQEETEEADNQSRPATGELERKGTPDSASAVNSEAGAVSVPVGGSATGTGGSPALPVQGTTVTLSVDRERRHAIERHHTVTHLLHWALHEVASREASQKGSFVGPDKLTFDFNSAPLTPRQVADIEKLVNERIVENAPVSWVEVKHKHIKDRQDVMQFFGDKYGEWVRVVQIGGKASALDGYSMELCGGTHTRATGEIGLFRIMGESAIAAGVRRIEAVAGLEAYQVAQEQLQLIRSIAGKINSPVHELEKKVESLLAHQKELEKSLKSAIQRNAAQTASWLLTRAQEVGGIPLITQNFPDSDADYLQAIVDALKGRFQGVAVVGGAAGGAVALIASVSPEFTKRVQAGKIIQQIAPLVGGKGGGKPDNARGGGKDAGKLDEALARVKALLGN
ncbi:MAG TPA: alanine--tRNA ligase-related protein, partial [Candidatus Acidoferrales bacterium]|nr:alanine--tRNA ligase-related protein [Candidatus Acidoferrales bacterium]